MYRLSRGSLLRYFPIQYVFPIILLLGSSFGCVLALLFHTTALQDRMEHGREAELIRHSFAATAEMVEYDVQDYARWDDAVRHIVQHFDAAWADDNISAYLGTVKGYDHVLAVDSRGRAVYAFSQGRRRAAGFDPGRLFGAGFAADLARVRRIPPAANPLLSGFTRAGDRIYAYSVASIVPLTAAVSLAPGPTMTLVLVRRIDSAFVAKLEQRYRMPHVRLTDRPRDGVAVVPLVDAAGRRIAWLGWVPHRPGSDLRRIVLPGFAIVVLISLAAAALILLRARRGMDALRRSEGQASHDSLHDALTGLGNRRATMEALRATSGRIVLLYMDLDGFKETNDVYGHAAGDALLIEAARRIAQAAPDARLVARSGGDEFAIVLAAPPADRPAEMAAEILDAFHAPFAVGGYSVSAGISIGSADNAGCDADELVRRADVAMYAAKANGKDCWCAYQPDMDDGYAERRALEGDLRAAIGAGDIGVAFQPIIDARTGRVAGVEALARWHHPRRGPISPDIFIRVAERSGLINELGRSVLTTACREAIGWGVDLAVNLSPAQFWDRTLVARVRTALAETGFPPGRLELEITESYLLRRPDAAELILLDLRALGIRIALDDFGTGFASIGYLRQLSLDRIKIDRSFVTDVARDTRSADMARAIVALAEALDLAVTAEGIETAEQAEIMRVIGCTRLQGWLFGRPMTAAAASAWLAEARLVRA